MCTSTAMLKEGWLEMKMIQEDFELYNFTWMLFKDCHVEHSIVGVRSRLEYGVEMKDTMMMGSDYYQTEAEITSIMGEGKVPMGVGSKTKISFATIEECEALAVLGGILRPGREV
ncbi:hypothetical protein GIB67_032992 [Kingdonia uniflora]|uniref:glucose-1-phosphate adenylyltransferase n=1 Tax=Kingdonia uniflora TaxID=39325 RepID=A0A7J7MZ00_9MAGN|nr:hypothetical protein GIB67_032992 [Kingdonia uniflora]